MKPASPNEIHAFLSGARYPVSKEQLIRMAIANSAPEPVRRTLQSLLTVDFETGEFVTQAVAAVGRRETRIPALPE